MSNGGNHRTEIEELRQQLSAKDALLAARTAELAAAKTGLIVKTLEAEKLKAQLAKLRREKFGASSERIERAIEQFELALEEVEAATAEITAATNQTEARDTPPAPDGSAATDKKKRRQLPPGLPRRDIVHAPADACKACGGTELRQVGESVTEVLEYIPGRFEVTRHVRPAVSCRKCEAMMQAPMPDLPIPRGMAGASLLAHVATSKFCDHLPLYRQAEIYARSGVDVDRGQLAEWLGHVAWLLKPLGELIARHVMAGCVIHADDTPVPVLAPGAGRTKTGRQWVYLRDERPHGRHRPAGLALSLHARPQGRALSRSARQLHRLAACGWLRRLRQAL
jgi:transposase